MAVLTLVLDASAAVELLLDTDAGRAVDDVLGSAALLAPQLLDVEVCSALARLERAGRLSTRSAADAVDLLDRLPVLRIEHEPLRAAAWALRGRVRVADAFYVACAAASGADLVTCDARLVRAGPGVRCRLVVTA